MKMIPLLTGRLLRVALPLVALALPASLNAATCTINGSDNKQTIDGFGFSSAWCGILSDAKNNALYNTLGMSLLRIRIDPNRNNWGNEATNSSAAHARGARVMGTAWTPPASMKSNNNAVQGTLNTSQYGAYATFLRDAATAINLDWVSFQNEPDIDVTYESCRWTPTEMLNFVKNNSSTIGRKIVMPESFNFKDSYSDPTLNDSTAASKVSVIGGHIYGGGLNTHQNALNKGKRVWMTEHYISNSQSSISACMTIAKEIQDCMNNQMHAYFWWWVSENDSSVNLVNQSGTIFKNGYTIGQFAKWVRPGKQRIGATYNPTSGVFVTAYRNNGLVVVAINTSTSAVNQSFALQNITGVSSLIAHRTSSSQNMAHVGSVTVSNNAFNVQLPAQSVTTYHQF